MKIDLAPSLNIIQLTIADMATRSAPTFDSVVAAYTAQTEEASNEAATSTELEVRFTRSGVTRTAYDAVVAQLLSAGWTPTPPSAELRIMPEGLGARVQISGYSSIAQYCRTDSLDGYPDAARPVAVRKEAVKDPGGNDVGPYDNADFGFRVSLQTENELPLESLLVDWGASQKTFRQLSRVRFQRGGTPLAVDVSVVKTSSVRPNGQYIPSRTFRDSGILSSMETYEIEIEALDDARTHADLLGELRSATKTVLSGIQGTNYPTSIERREYALASYAEAIGAQPKTLSSRDFAGPGSYTLQAANAAPPNPNANIPNIRSGYSVTEKADGLRKLLFVCPDGSAWFIDTNMHAQFTGCWCDPSDAPCLIDGEHILHDATGNYINAYGAFDIYVHNGADVRSLDFAGEEGGRLSVLQSVAPLLLRRGSREGTPPPLRLFVKDFYYGSDTASIFDGCKQILDRVDDGGFEYKTDGLVFTPLHMAVGARAPGDPPATGKGAWAYSLKWKPIEETTIDFLVSVDRAATGTVFQEGTDTKVIDQVTQYNTVVLQVGHDRKKHGSMIDPCSALRGFEPPISRGSGSYRPVQFVPTNPPDRRAGITKIALQPGANGALLMMTPSGEVVEDDTIVEFSYNIDAAPGWRWSPVRVRADKTADYRSGGRNYGNAFHVADSNWHAIHNPITRAMITTGDGIPDELADSDVYYNARGAPTRTRALRDFHNLYVKQKLISAGTRRWVGLSRPRDRGALRNVTVLDLAVGKGGDIPKWIEAGVAFVFGIDVSTDNIINRTDGACMRMLNYRKKFRKVPTALFVAGDSSKDVLGDEALSPYDKATLESILGIAALPKNPDLGPVVRSTHGVASGGFDATSIQFALHYMAATPESWYGFLQNVGRLTKVGGTFFGTCYDGAELFDALSGKKEGESLTLDSGGGRIWEVTKRYSNLTFPGGAQSLGLGVDVLQETIGKTFREYLVNFRFLDASLREFGFEPLTNEEARGIGLQGAQGGFRELYDDMLREDPGTKYGAAAKMTASEKQLSFLNRYFVYKKVRETGQVETPVLHSNVTTLEPPASSAPDPETDPATPKPTRRRPTAKRTLRIVTQSDDP